MAQLQKGTTYITGDQVTAANLNALVDSGILTPGAVTDQTAKTVPLAADTILLHSAADTALRKTTMTQLFATPQPLGATTPSTGAFTTGTFSSTLGVTGVATLGNGAVLGTPASGTLTNCTIPASALTGATLAAGVTASSLTSLGTIAALSAGTGTFTRGSAGQVLSLLSGNVAQSPYVSIGRASEDARVTIAAAINDGVTGSAVGDIIYGSNANSWIGIAGSGVAKFTSTGLNSTVIGATTPSTGAFTTISSTTGANFATSSGSVGIGTASPSYKLDVQSTTDTKLLLTGSINQNGMRFGAAGSANEYYFASGNNLVAGGDKGFVIYNTTASQPQLFIEQATRNISVYAAFSVGGAVSATGAISTAATGEALTLNSGGTAADTYLKIKRGSGTYWLIAHDSLGGLTFNRDGTDKAYFGRNGVDGLSVTGTLSATTTFTCGGGGTSAGSGNFGFVTGANGIAIISNDNESGATFQSYRNAGGTVIGSITRVGTSNAVAYNTSSDARLKENFRDFTDSGRLIDALKPRVFDWKDSDGNGKDVIGFVAQEEHAADPVFAHIGAISVGDDDPTTITKLWQRSDTALIPILVAELQSLRKRLAALESK